MDVMHTPIIPADIIMQDGTPESATYGDVYYSRGHGRAESEYTYLEANRLRERFCACTGSFTIAETGFGTGLNFLLTWDWWNRYAPPDATLHYISVEKHPIKREQLRECLQEFTDLEALTNKLTAYYPLPIPGAHTIGFANDRVRLTLCLMDVSDMFHYLKDSHVNAWFLDGFAPAKNPAMWTPELYTQLARCSAADATLATFTAASAVRTGLSDAGFSVTRIPGFGRKRHMVTAHYKKAYVPAANMKHGQPDVIVIGAGIAGASAAYHCAIRGMQVRVLERSNAPATHASGNPAGILYPFMARQWDAATCFYLAAFAHVVRLLDMLAPQGAVFDRCGMYHTAKTLGDAGATDALRHLPEALGLDESILQTVADGMIMPASGWVDIPSVCRAMLNHANISLHTNVEAKALTRHDNQWEIISEHHATTFYADTVIIANAADAATLFPDHYLPMRRIGGQITAIPDTMIRQSPAVVRCYGGYVTPVHRGAAVCGATFDPSLQTDDVTRAAHQENIDRLQRHLPDMLSDIDINALTGRTAFRTVSADRFPIIGALHNQQALDDMLRETPYSARAKNVLHIPHLPNLYLSLAHGARGMVSAPLAGAWIANMVGASALQQHPEIRDWADSARFTLRRWRKSK